MKFIDQTWGHRAETWGRWTVVISIFSVFHPKNDVQQSQLRFSCSVWNHESELWNLVSVILVAVDVVYIDVYSCGYADTTKSHYPPGRPTSLLRNGRSTWRASARRMEAEAPSARTSPASWRPSQNNVGQGAVGEGDLLGGQPIITSYELTAVIMDNQWIIITNYNG